MLGRVVALDLVVELEAVAVGVAEAVAGAAAAAALDPALAEAGGLDRGDAPLERLGAAGAQPAATPSRPCGASVSMRL